MRAIALLVGLVTLLAVVPSATANHLGPVDDSTQPRAPNLPVPNTPSGGCVGTTMAARVCVALADGAFQSLRTSTYGPVGTGVIISAPDPASPRFETAAFGPSTSTSGTVRVFDDNGDGVPDGLAVGGGLRVNLLGLDGVAAGTSVRDSSGDGIPETPSADGAGLPSVPNWVPRPPNTPHPLPSLRPVYDALGL